MLNLVDLRGHLGGSDHERRARISEMVRSSAETVAQVDVSEIMDAVRSRGDAALIDFTKVYDEVEIESVRVPPTDVEAALRDVDPMLREALEEAAESIAAYHRSTRPTDARYEREGITVRDHWRAVRSAGCYVPGGHAQYPSSVLMTAIPARVAGVERVVLCVPPQKDGKVATSVLAAAAIAEVDEVYCVGGAQSIAGLAYGTESIAAVDVIVGAGNQFVAAAKRHVLGEGVVGVPSTWAGPSEITVIVDETTPPELAAIDLIVEAEHGPGGKAWLVTWSEEVANRVQESIATIAARSERRDEIETNLTNGGFCVIVDDSAMATEVSNVISPEQLQIMTVDPEALLPMIEGAGAIYLGVNSPAAIGDYVAGPSHILPVGGSARFASALGVRDFLCYQHVVTADEQTLMRIAPHIAAIAAAEGLDAHARAVRMRQRP